MTPKTNTKREKLYITEINVNCRLESSFKQVFFLVFDNYFLEGSLSAIKYN